MELLRPYTLYLNRFNCGLHVVWTEEQNTTLFEISFFLMSDHVSLYLTIHSILVFNDLVRSRSQLHCRISYFVCLFQYHQLIRKS